MLTTRKATGKDLNFIRDLFRSYEFTLDESHLVSLYVVEDHIGIVAVGSLVTILEASFLSVEHYPKYTKVKAFESLIAEANMEAKFVGYPSYTACNVSDNLIERTLKKSFGFVDCIGKSLIKWVS